MHAGNRLSRLVASLLLFVGLSGVAASAVAHPKSGEIVFDELELEVSEYDQLRVDYEFDAASWSFLRERDVEPTMVFYFRGHHDEELEFVYSFTVSAQSGSYTLPDEIEVVGGDVLEVGLSGFHQGWRVETIAHEEHGGARLAFERHQDHFDSSARNDVDCPAGHLESEGARSDDDGHGNHHHEDGEADDDHGDHHDEGHGDHQDDQSDDSDEDETGGGNEEAGEDSGPPEGWKAATISACRKHAEYDSDVPDCVEQAKKIEPKWAAEAVTACAESVEYESDLIECVEIARRHDDYAPAEAVRACADASEYESDILECFESTSDYEAKPAPIVEACAGAVEFESDIQECVEFGARLDSGGADLVKACSGGDWKQCMERAMD